MGARKKIMSGTHNKTCGWSVVIMNTLKQHQPMERPLRITLHLHPLTADEVALPGTLRPARHTQGDIAAPRLSTLNAVRAAARAFRPL